MWAIEILTVILFGMGWYPCCCQPAGCECRVCTGPCSDPVLIEIFDVANDECDGCDYYNGSWSLATPEYYECRYYYSIADEGHGFRCADEGAGGDFGCASLNFMELQLDINDSDVNGVQFFMQYIGSGTTEVWHLQGTLDSIGDCVTPITLTFSTRTHTNSFSACTWPGSTWACDWTGATVDIFQ